MKIRILFSMLTLTVYLCFFPQQAPAEDDPEARAIMQKEDERDDGDNMTGRMEMILIDKNKNKRIRQINMFGKDKGEDELSIMFFLSPADVKDTGFLTYDYEDPDKDDDQWLYLSAMKRTKRIATSNKSGSFMGSDLNYSDMTDYDLVDYDYTFAETGKETDINGHKVWVIQALPRSRKIIKETGYRKSLLFVRQDNYFVIRVISWEKKKGYIKYTEVKKLELIDNIWTATEMHVKRKQGKNLKHQTILKLKDVKYNQDLSCDLFTIRRLEKGN